MTARQAEKPVIVIAAFGSTKARGLRNLGDFNAIVRERFPDHDIRWALIAQSVVNMLRKAGVATMFNDETPLKSLDEVYRELREQGCKNVVVQCLMIMPGQKTRQILSRDTGGLQVRYGDPLLANEEDVPAVVAALSPTFGGADTATILCAHGNERYPEYNATLIEMDRYVRANYQGVYLATVEGPPGYKDVVDEVRASGVSRVKFVPLMLVEGDHIINDVMGDEPDSWRSLIGLPAAQATGLASNPDVMAFFLESIAKLVEL
jgi:sirohydrochlorin cobaltochelatase